MASHQPGRRPRSIAKTVRIDEDTDRQLEKLASEKRVSVSHLANQALRRFVEWDIYSERLGFVSLPPDIFEKMLGYLTEAQAKELGGWVGRNLAKDLVVFLFKKIDLETSVRAMELLGPRYGKAFRFEYSSDGQLTTVILNHGFGRNGSLFYGEAVKTLLQNLVNTQVDIEVSEHQVFARITSLPDPPLTMS